MTLPIQKPWIKVPHARSLGAEANVAHEYVSTYNDILYNLGLCTKSKDNRADRDWGVAKW